MDLIRRIWDRLCIVAGVICVCAGIGIVLVGVIVALKTFMFCVVR